MDDLEMKIWITSHIDMQSCGYVFFVNKKKNEIFLNQKTALYKKETRF